MLPSYRPKLRISTPPPQATYVSPGITMQKIAGWAEPFFNGGAFLEGKDAVHYFSLGNLKGALISIVIGVFLYFVFVRRFLCEKEEGGMYYKNCIPVWLDLEDGIYRPLCCYLLPLLFEVPCRLADGLVSEKFFARILPFMLAVPCRILDKFVGGMVYVVNRTVFRQVREKEHVVMGDRLAYYAGSAADCISRIYRRVSKKGAPLSSHLFVRSYLPPFCFLINFLNYSFAHANVYFNRSAQFNQVIFL